MMSHVQVPHGKGRRTAFIERKRKFEGYSKQTVSGFSLVEFLPGKWRSRSSSWWTLILFQGVSVPLLISQLYLIEVSAY